MNNIDKKIKQMLGINNTNMFSSFKQKKKQNTNMFNTDKILNNMFFKQKQFNKLKEFNINNMFSKQKQFNIKNNNINKSKRILRQDFFTPIRRQSFTKNEMIKILQHLAQELGRTPITRDIDERSDIPSSSTFQKLFGSWNNAIKEAGLPLRKRTDYTKEELIIILQNFVQKMGRSPMQRDLINNSDLPSLSIYQLSFGTWNNALKEAGITLVKRRDYTKEELITTLQNFAQELGRTPMKCDLKQRSDLPSDTTYDLYFGSWNKALYEAGLTPTKRMDYTKEEVITTLQNFAQELGRVPMIADIKQRSDLPSEGLYINFFGTWNNALEEAGLDLKKPYTKNELIQIIQKLAQELERVPITSDLRYRSDLPSATTFQLHFGTWDNVLNAAGITSAMREDNIKNNLIKTLQEFAQKIGRTPMKSDLKNNPDLPSNTTFRNYFGTWNKALYEAGLEPVRKQNYTKEELIQIIQKLAQEIGRPPTIEDLYERTDLPHIQIFINHFGTWEHLLYLAGLLSKTSNIYTKEELIQIIQDLAQKLKRVPKVEDIKNASDLPSFYLFKDYFGSWTNALNEAGLK